MRTSHPARDCELSAEVVTAVLRDQFPELAPHDVRFLAAGYDHEAYEVNGEWIVRMPMRAEIAVRVPIEREVLALAGEALELEVPRVSLRGVPSAHYPYPFLGYRKLAGVTADRMPLDAFCSHDNARILGGTIGALHRIPLARAEAIGLAYADPDDRSGANRAARVLRALPELEPVLGPARTTRCAEFVAERPLIAPDVGANVLRHDDLFLEHVLVDPATSLVTGIIDWTDASIGEPSGEFALLLACCGERFLGAVLDAYDGPSDPQLPARVRVRARWGVLDWIRSSLERAPADLPDWLACFDRVFAAR